MIECFGLHKALEIANKCIRDCEPGRVIYWEQVSLTIKERVNAVKNKK